MGLNNVMKGKDHPDFARLLKMRLQKRGQTTPPPQQTDMLRVTSQQVPTTHYIAMSGQRGAIPNNVEVFGTVDEAVGYLVDMFHIGRGRQQMLKYHHFLDLSQSNTPEHLKSEDLMGVEYCEIQTCNCRNPQQHSDSGAFVS